MKRAYQKDIWRTIRKEKKRFISILAITVLGVVMLTGIRAACVDLKESADDFFDQQKLYDVAVISTLGLTESDLDTLAALQGVSEAEGTYSEKVYTMWDGKKQTAQVKELSDIGMNAPKVVEGTLPSTAIEIAVTDKYRKETGKTIGDSVEIEEESNEDSTDEEEANFKNTVFTITGIVIDPMDVTSTQGPASFRSTSATEYTFFVTKEAVQSEIYTAIYLTLKDTIALPCYSDAYNAAVNEIIRDIETQVKQVQEDARTREIKGIAEQKLSEARTEADKEFTDAREKLTSARTELEQGKTQLLNAKAELEANEKIYQVVLMDAREEIKSQEDKLEKAAATLIENEKEFDRKKADVEGQFADAQKEIDEMKPAQWYVQSRSSLSGYANIQSDSSSIEAIGRVFPVLFLIVAVLISLTTITRLVEEERGLIGTYKALGFTNREIRRKYVRYAGLACIIGSGIGNLGGFILFPKIIFTVFQTMYQIPTYYLRFDWIYGLGGAALFTIGIIAATIIACGAELKQTPATLMRPRAPKAGAGIFLEFIPWLWNRFSFLNKVTARNLFRYKKRFFMTVGGIMGCTALVVCGFAIKDSLKDLMPRQYEDIYAYDVMAVATTKGNAPMVSYLEEKKEVESIRNLKVSTVTVKNKHGELENVQLLVVPDEESLDGYINLVQEDGTKQILSDQGIYITQNASIVLDFTRGDIVSLKDVNLNLVEVPVSGIIRNYLGNNVVMSQSYFETVFHTEYEPNAALLKFSAVCNDRTEFIDELSGRDGVIRVVSTQKLRSDFDSAFALVNMVVGIIIIMAAGLAFVVLFTLANTNISERIRELSTIKVLGFYDREVHLYVNKETLILTALGIVLGLPLGAALGRGLTQALRMPSVYFAVSIHPISFVFAAVISFSFAIIVDLITNRLLDRVDPVEALKSVE